MPTYIALLRGINVSGQKKLKMAELKEAMVQWGFKNVRTYIQSGNLVFDFEGDEIDKIKQRIESGIAEIFGYDVGVWVRERASFIRIIDQNPFEDTDETVAKQIYFVFLNDQPAKELVEKLQSEAYVNEEFKISDECIFLFCSAGYGKAKCNNNFFESKLKVEATTRNHRTVRTLRELSAQS